MTPAIARSVPATIPVRVISPEDMAARANKIHALVARRAYEIFESQGRPEGCAAEHWFQAETEVRSHAPIGFMQSKTVLSVYVAVPGATARDLEVCVEPRRITVSGRKSIERKRKNNGRKTPFLIFRTVDLPCEVDPGQVSAKFANSILVLEITKRQPGSKAA